MLTSLNSFALCENPAQVLMQFPALVAMLEGPEHTFVLANALYQEIVGRGRNLVGKSFREAMPEPEDHRVCDVLDKIYCTGVAYKESESLVLVKGENGEITELYFNFVYQPIRDADNSVTGILIHAVDVTEHVHGKKKLQRSEEQFKSFVMNSPVPTGIYVGKDMVIHMANDAILEAWDKKPGIIGKTFREALPELEGQPYYDLLDHVFTTGETYRAMEDKAVLFRNGRMETAYFSFTYKALKDESGQIWGVMNTGVEVTEIVEARNSIQQAEEELEEQVKLRTIELEKLNTDLMHTNEQLRQFAYVASHDLQEPLRKINIYSDRLANRLDHISGNDEKQYLSKIIASAKRMSTLIRDLLDYTHLDSVKETFVPVNLNKVAEIVKEDFEMLIAQKSAKVAIGDLGTIEANPLHVNQLIYNLVSNALKFSKEGQRPEVSIQSRLLTREDVAEFETLNHNWIHREIIVSDNGIGFDPQYARQVFVIFQRLNGNGKFEGTGIGLALCKKIVDHHQGEIFAISNEGEGSSFHIVLPVTRA